MVGKYKLIIPAEIKPRPRQYEMDVATVLANYFKADVEFVARSNQRTPDFLINGILWELKSPQGKGKNNIQRQLQYAKNQSVNVIIDASRSKKHPIKIRREVEYQFGIIKSIKRLIFVSKDKELLELKR